MKRILILLASFIFVVSLLDASVTGRVSLSEEIAYQKYNKIWQTPEYQYFSVESVASNPNLVSNLDLMFGDYLGITMGTEFGYQTSIEDKNRFVTFPDNINGTICSGVLVNFKSLRITIEALLRSSFLLTRNSWISQVGCKTGISYLFPCGLFFDMNYKYISSYKMITSAVSIGLGYQFGGKK